MGAMLLSRTAQVDSLGPVGALVQRRLHCRRDLVAAGVGSADVEHAADVSLSLSGFCIDSDGRQGRGGLSCERGAESTQVMPL